MQSLSLSVKGNEGIIFSLVAFLCDTSLFWLQIVALSKILPILAITSKSICP